MVWRANSFLMDPASVDANRLRLEGPPSRMSGTCSGATLGVTPGKCTAACLEG